MRPPPAGLVGRSTGRRIRATAAASGRDARCAPRVRRPWPRPCSQLRERVWQPRRGQRGRHRSARPGACRPREHGGRPARGRDRRRRSGVCRDAERPDGVGRGSLRTPSHARGRARSYRPETLSRCDQRATDRASPDGARPLADTGCHRAHVAGTARDRRRRGTHVAGRRESGGGGPRHGAGSRRTGGRRTRARGRRVDHQPDRVGDARPALRGPLPVRSQRTDLERGGALPRRRRVGRCRSEVRVGIGASVCRGAAGCIPLPARRFRSAHVGRGALSSRSLRTGRCVARRRLDLDSLPGPGAGADVPGSDCRLVTAVDPPLRAGLGCVARRPRGRGGRPRAVRADGRIRRPRARPRRRGKHDARRTRRGSSGYGPPASRGRTALDGRS